MASLNAPPSRGQRGAVRRYDWVAWTLAAGTSAGFALVLADCVARQTWEGIAVGEHVGAGLVLAGTLGALLGAGGLVVVAATLALRRLLPTRLRPAVAPALTGAAAGAAIWSTARWMFSGAGVQTSRLASYGPYVAVLFTVMAGAVAALLVQLGLAWGRSGRVARTIAWIAAGLSLAGALVYVDLTYFVSLYSRLHTVLEVSAFGTAGAAAAISMVLGARRAPRAVLAGAALLAAVGPGVLIAYSMSPGLRLWTSEALRHVWREPVYLGRVLARAEMAESYVSNPRAWTGQTMAGVHRLRERYDILTTACDPAWLEPPPEPASLTADAAQLRDDRAPSVLVYYVDTLRADVARDPKIMPNAVRFAATALDFRNAYTTGSDTLHALPGMLGGRYDLFDERSGDLLRVAARNSVRSVLFSPASAIRFLGKLLPRFKFDAVHSVVDHAADKKVWGYGADMPTAERLVDSTLEWVRAHTGQRFLGWVFNFDVHAWRELDETYINEQAAKFGMREEEGKLSLRYRVAARAVDVAFGRLLHELDRIPMDRDLIVLFVSDHGEGLGREGFWVHSIFLWEALIHVPLYIRVPGVPARAVDARVSLVDIAPTLARAFAPGTPLTEYHGEDLLTYARDNRPTRRFPLLLVSTEKEKLCRLGVIDPVEPYKLVLPLEAAAPELYDLGAVDPDSVDVSRSHRPQMLRMLSTLVRSPLFPRSAPVPTAEEALNPLAQDGAAWNP